jgi:hypothetical protein
MTVAVMKEPTYGRLTFEIKAVTVSRFEGDWVWPDEIAARAGLNQSGGSR